MTTESTAQLSDYSRLLRRQWGVIAASVATALALAGAYTAVAPSQYTSSTSVLVTATGLPS